MRLRALVLVVVLVVSLGACGGGGDAGGGSASGPSTSSGAFTGEQALTRYLGLTAAVNKANDTFRAAVTGASPGGSVKPIAAAASGLADALAAMATGLRQPGWPASVTDQVTDLARVDDALAAYYRKVAAATSPDDLVKAGAPDPTLLKQSAADAEALRQKLGLPAS